MDLKFASKPEAGGTDQQTHLNLQVLEHVRNIMGYRLSNGDIQTARRRVRNCTIHERRRLSQPESGEDNKHETELDDEKTTSNEQTLKLDSKRTTCRTG